MPDDANLSELLDDDKLPAEYPPDRPLGVDEEALTARGEQTDEPLEERVRREEPDVAVTGLADDSVGPLVAPGGDEGLDVTKEEVASDIGNGSDQDSLDVGDIASGDTTTRDVATERVNARSAEEEAVHLTEDPPLGDGDGYV
ncbi:MAG TPA: hypothetical protein VGV93_04950 [Acidimicrobiales bacterium]|nr:hypothetical protein [Acidimicrobiales bacterium]